LRSGKKWQLRKYKETNRKGFNRWCIWKQTNMNNNGSLKVMSNEQKKDWFSILGLVEDKAEILEWGRKTYPIYSKNENMMAQMWWTQHEGKVLPEQRRIATVEELRKGIKALIDADDLVDEKGKPRKVWGNIEVLIVGPLGDSKPYFGCEKCTRGIDKNIGICLNDDPDYGHAGEQVEGKMIAWQNWQAGDGTDEVIITFAPNKKQSPHQIQSRILTLAGSMNVRDGRYSVWDIVANRTAASPGGSGANIDIAVPVTPKVEETVVEEVVVDDEKIDESVSTPTEELDEDDGKFFEETVEAEAEAGEGTGTTLRERIPAYDGLVTAFKKSVDKHVGTKKVPVENMHKFLLVRPQMREVVNPEEAVTLFLQEMVVEKIIKIDGDYLTRV